MTRVGKCRYISLVSLGTVAFLCLALNPAQTYAKVFALVGDSTVAPNDGNDGWGDALIHFLPDGNRVVNHGANGRSTQSYINEGRWKAVLELKPDYILIQFGHNDQKVNDANRGTHAVDNPKTPPPSGNVAESTANPTGAKFYRENLRRMIDDAQSIGAKPVLVTPVARRTTPYGNAKAQVDWNDTPQASDSLGNSYSLKDYADATKAVGKEKNVPVIDLNGLSLDLYADMISKGEDISSLGPAGDNTHLNHKGMEPIAKLVADALQPVISH